MDDQPCDIAPMNGTLMLPDHLDDALVKEEEGDGISFDEVLKKCSGASEASKSDPIEAQRSTNITPVKETPSKELPIEPSSSSDKKN